MPVPIAYSHRPVADARISVTLRSLDLCSNFRLPATGYAYETER